MIRSKGLQKVQRRSVPLEIATQLRDYILTENLPPGFRLPNEQELCETFGASRVSVREALKLLEGSGLINVKPGAASGIRVAQPAPQPWRDAFAAFCHLQNVPIEHLVEFRIALERVTASLAAARASDNDIRKLDAIAQAMEAPGMTLEHFHELDITFHTRLAELSGNELFALVMHAVRYAMQRAILDAYRELEYPEMVNRQIASDHREIVRHLSRRDAQAAAATTSQHIQRFYTAAFQKKADHG
jgi:GntR family transcriptional repressor for pyruvate dehydrogenase complex